MKYKLSNLCEYRKGKIDISDLTNETYISTENMIPNRGGTNVASALPNVKQTNEYREGDVLVSNIRP